jgi:osomolarity two-component system, response regulator SKN7
VTSSVTDDYMSIQGHSGGYGMQSGLTPGISYASGPQTPMGAPSRNQHRRQISEISGGDEMNNNAKRQQMYGQPMPPQHNPMNPLQQRPR